MDAKTSIKKRLPSRHVTEGPERAPHRSYLYAMGLTTEQIHQPFVGVASCWNEAAPCNIALMRQAQAVKKGVASAGGTPREFCTITVTDGIAMGHDGMRSSLPSRECIADSVELTVRGHAYDALVGLAGCDKSLPGMMMAMVRLNVPSIFIYGGSILPGNFRGQQVTVQDMFEAVGKHSVGEMSDADLDEIERVACPSAGACGAQFTANTMATVSEAIGLALPYSAGAPAPYEIRDAFCMTAGEKVMELISANIRPRDIVTRKAIENAATVIAAAGGSTNGGLHIPAIANEVGIEFDLHDFGEICKRTPYIADLKPGGMGNLGAAQLKWLKADLAACSSSQPIVVFAHIPLWTVYADWGWGTDDSAEALKLLARFGSVTVLNGHIHQITQKVEGRIAFHTARSTAFPQPAPGTAPSPGPLKVPPEQLHNMLGITDALFVRGHDRIALIDSTLSA